MRDVQVITKCDVRQEGRRGQDEKFPDRMRDQENFPGERKHDTGQKACG